MESPNLPVENDASTDSAEFVAWPRWTPAVAAGAMAMVALISVWTVHRNAASRYANEVRADTLRDLATVRGAAEIAINRRVHLTRGLKAHVSINPDMTAEEFASFSALLMSEVDGIRSVTSIKDNIINDVYPREGNEGAIGLDLLKNPEQRAAAEYAIETGQPWLAGPIKLVQGGEAFINRAPVYVTEPGGLPGAGRYWGMVSILIDKQTLTDEILRSVPDGLQIAIRGRNSRSEPGEIFLGDSQIEMAHPISIAISLPTGSWQLYGVPKAGWPEGSPQETTIELIGALIAACATLLVFATTRLLSEYRNYSHRLEVANTQVKSAHRIAEESRQSAADKATQLEVTVEQLKAAQLATLNILDDIEDARSKLQESTDALEESNLELQQFAYVASHDLQTPLRAVAGFAQILKSEYKGQLDESADVYIETIVNGCKRMQTMIRDLLTYSRVESRSLPAESVDLSSVIDDAISVLSAAVQESGGQVTYEELPTVTGDQSQLAQLLMNLIANGLKYHGSEPPHVHVAAEGNEHDWTISVRDNGIGIDSRFHEQIFEVFRRLHTQEEYPGTGIGLAVCRRIVKRHGGRLWLTSEPGKGTTFFFTIPRTGTGLSAGHSATELELDASRELSE